MHNVQKVNTFVRKAAYEVKRKEVDMEDKVRQVCLEHGVTPDVLTPEERQMLEDEIIAEEKGYTVLGGVFSDASILYRKRD